MVDLYFLFSPQTTNLDLFICSTIFYFHIHYSLPLFFLSAFLKLVFCFLLELLASFQFFLFTNGIKNNKIYSLKMIFSLALPFLYHICSGMQCFIIIIFQIHYNFCLNFLFDSKVIKQHKNVQVAETFCSLCLLLISSFIALCPENVD